MLHMAHNNAPCPKSMFIFVIYCSIAVLMCIISKVKPPICNEYTSSQ